MTRRDYLAYASIRYCCTCQYRSGAGLCCKCYLTQDKPNYKYTPQEGYTMTDQETLIDRYYTVRARIYRIGANKFCKRANISRIELSKLMDLDTEATLADIERMEELFDVVAHVKKNK